MKVLTTVRSILAIVSFDIFVCLVLSQDVVKAWRTDVLICFMSMDMEDNVILPVPAIPVLLLSNNNNNNNV